jgi:drug/metabolite transporter (DMT)-like permease
MKFQDTRAILAGIFAVVLWAAIPSLVKISSDNLPISLLVLFRFGISMLAFVWFVPGLVPKIKLVEKKYLVGLFFVLGMNYFFQSVAMHRLPASWYIVIFALNPILALICLRLRMSTTKWICIFVAAIGSLLFIQAKEVDVLFEPLTFVSLVIGMLTWVGYTVLISGFQKHFSDFEVTSLTHIVSFLAALTIWLGSGMPWQTPNTGDLAAVIILGLVTPFAYYFFAYCLRRNPTFGVVSQYLEPVVGVLLGVILFKESLSWIQIAGASTIIASMSIAEKK